jgi:hypothetical protein
MENPLQQRDLWCEVQFYTVIIMGLLSLQICTVHGRISGSPLRKWWLHWAYESVHNMSFRHFSPEKRMGSLGPQISTVQTIISYSPPLEKRWVHWAHRSVQWIRLFWAFLPRRRWVHWAHRLVQYMRGFQALYHRENDGFIGPSDQYST